VELCSHRLQDAPAALSAAMPEANAAIDVMRKEHDAIASQIFVVRRDYQTISDTKSSKRY